MRKEDEPENRFGLQTMRERAESIGAGFRLESAFGVGTKVAVTVPVQKTAEVEHANS